jgi:hypothetical protein
MEDNVIKNLTLMEYLTECSEDGLENVLEAVKEVKASRKEIKMINMTADIYDLFNVELSTEDYAKFETMVLEVSKLI